MKIAFLLFLLAVGLSCTNTFAANTTELSPQTIQTRIQQHGAKAVVDALNEENAPTDFDRVIAHIETGQSDWLKIAHSLATGSDAGFSTSLIIALATALPKNPEGVLSILDGSAVILTVSDVCSVPFIEPTYPFLRSYFSKTKKALNKKLSGKIEDRRKECLNTLQNSERQI